MGRKKKKTKGGRGTVALRTDAKGNVAYDEILRQGQNKDKIIYSKYQDLVPVNPSGNEEDELARPSDKQIAEHTEATRKALEKRLSGRLSASTPRTGAKKQTDEPVFIKYTPANQSALHNSGATSRILKLHEMPTDPLEPPKFRCSKGPRAPPSPPVPVMHSPPRKVTLKDQQNWKVPPCVSNWKNNRGYVIPLHQRVAADGRHLQSTAINDKFAELAGALYIAERTARKEVEMRAAAVLKKMKEQKKTRTKQLKEIAKDVMRGNMDDMSEREAETPIFDRGTPVRGTPSLKEQQEGKDARDRIREERKRERRKQRAKERHKPGARDRTKARDISEKIALGQASGKQAGGVYDSRLFDRESGMQQGFGADDGYNLYDKPLFATKSQTIYKPTQLNDVEDIKGGTERFKAHQGFEGASASRGNAPVQFEKDTEDPFGMAEIAKDKDREKSHARSRKRSRRSASPDSDSDSDDRRSKRRRR